MAKAAQPLPLIRLPSLGELAAEADNCGREELFMLIVENVIDRIDVPMDSALDYVWPATLRNMVEDWGKKNAHSWRAVHGAPNTEPFETVVVQVVAVILCCLARLR
jgi:hypothetical protein